MRRVGVERRRNKQKQTKNQEKENKRFGDPWKMYDQGASTDHVALLRDLFSSW